MFQLNNTKTAILFGLIILLFLPVTIVAQTVGPRLDFVPASIDLEVGEEIDVAITVTNPGEANVAELRIEYPNTVEIVAFQESGVLLGLDKRINAGLATMDVGKVGDSFGEGETIATLKFRLIAAANGTIRFADGTRVGESLINAGSGSLSITSLTPVEAMPEPAESGLLDNPVVLVGIAVGLGLVVVVLVVMIIRSRKPKAPQPEATPPAATPVPASEPLMPMSGVAAAAPVQPTMPPVPPAAPTPLSQPQSVPVVPAAPVQAPPPAFVPVTPAQPPSAMFNDSEPIMVDDVSQTSNNPPPEPDIAEMNASPKLRQVLEGSSVSNGEAQAFDSMPAEPASMSQTESMPMVSQAEPTQVPELTPEPQPQPEMASMAEDNSVPTVSGLGLGTSELAPVVTPEPVPVPTPVVQSLPQPAPAPTSASDANAVPSQTPPASGLGLPSWLTEGTETSESSSVSVEQPVAQQQGDQTVADLIPPLPPELPADFASEDRS